MLLSPLLLVLLASVVVVAVQQDGYISLIGNDMHIQAPEHGKVFINKQEYVPRSEYEARLRSLENRLLSLETATDMAEFYGDATALAYCGALHRLLPDSEAHVTYVVRREFNIDPDVSATCSELCTLTVRPSLSGKTKHCLYSIKIVTGDLKSAAASNTHLPDGKSVFSLHHYPESTDCNRDFLNGGPNYCCCYGSA